ncbi:MAG: hypothetical protein Q7K42_03205, partial [Candidatus Diapherotrites archaeon]|nr:hypothetical protein [Candidatus Diapherotrites archaeon]
DYDLKLFDSKERISAELTVVPQKTGTGTINVSLVADGQQVFNENILVNAQSGDELTVKVEPEELASGIENKLKLEVKSTVGLEQENAVATVLDRFKIVLAQGTTNRQGIVELKLPAQNPGDKLLLKVQKPGFNTKEINLNVSAGILELPANASIGVNTKTVLTKDVKFEAKNKSNFPFKINTAELQGNFKGILDDKEMNNYLKQFLGLVFEPGEIKELSLRALVSNEGRLLEERTEFPATLKLAVTNFSQNWVFEVPVKIAVGVGAEVSNPSCLNLSKQEWLASSEGQPIKTEFEIKNNCVVDNKPVLLRNLAVRFEPETNILGDYFIEVKENGISKAKMEVRSSYFKNVLGVIEPEKTYNVDITFRPNGGVIGDAKGRVLWEAVNQLDAGEQKVSTELGTEVNIFDVKECISFTNDIVTINTSLPPEQRIGKFGIETKDCGGKTKIKIESKLETETKEFTLSEKDKKEVVILPGNSYQGQYPLIVHVEPEHANTFREIKTIRVRLIDPTSCLGLQRYEFDVFDDPQEKYDGKDNTELINNCYNKPVQTKVSLKSMSDALQTGLLFGALAGGVTIAGNAIDPNTDWTGTPTNPGQGTAQGDNSTCTGEKPFCSDTTDDDYASPDKPNCRSGKWVCPGTETSTAQAATPANEIACTKTQGYSCETESNCSNPTGWQIGSLTIPLTGSKQNGCGTGLVCCPTGKIKTTPPATPANPTATEPPTPVQPVAPTIPITNTSTAETPPVTTSKPQTNNSGTGFASLGDSFGGGGTAILGFLSNGLKTMLGSTNPLVTFGMTTVVTTLGTYFSQGDASFTVYANDLAVNYQGIKLLKDNSSDAQELPEDKIKLDVSNSVKKPKAADRRTQAEFTGMNFSNAKPGDWNGNLFDILVVPGKQNVYDESFVYGYTKGNPFGSGSLKSAKN